MHFRLFIFLLIFVVGHLSAGVIKESKTSVSFVGFGKYITNSTVKLQDMRKLENTKNEFKGEGFMGNITAKLILKPGNKGQLFALNEMKMYDIDHNEKEYRVLPIQKFNFDSYENAKTEEEYSEEEGPQDQESTIRIIRNEFKVEDTGEKKNINNFSCKKYIATWILEWEDTESEDRGKDSLLTFVWTTQLTEKMKVAQEEEMKFAKEYLSQIGIQTEEFWDDVLGTRWMEMFSQLSQSRTGSYDKDNPDFVNEMAKIDGYPVVTDGKYFAIRPNQTPSETTAETNEKPTVRNPRNVKGLFGGIMKKTMKKKMEPEKKQVSGPQPAFSFYNELIRFEPKNLNSGDIAIPTNYTMVESEQQ